MSIRKLGSIDFLKYRNYKIYKNENKIFYKLLEKLESNIVNSLMMNYILVDLSEN